MALYGLLIDYNYCSGCRTCEIACQKEHNYDPQKQGIRLGVIGPARLPGGKWQFDNLPMHTPYCNHCISRIKKGKQPSCVHHCQAKCIAFGEVKDLLPKMTDEKMVLYTV